MGNQTTELNRKVSGARGTEKPDASWERWAPGHTGAACASRCAVPGGSGPGNWQPLPPRVPMSRLRRRVPATCRREENPTPRRLPERPLARTGVLWGPGPREGGGGSRSAARGRQKSPRGEQDCFFPVSRAGRGEEVWDERKRVGARMCPLVLLGPHWGRRRGPHLRASLN